MKNNGGFSTAEIVAVIGILSLIGVVVSSFQTDVFRNNLIIQEGLQADAEIRSAIRGFMKEMRGAAPSNAGSYPIELASSTAVTFYGDIDGDGLRERVRYYLDNKTLMRGIIKPTGQPYSYPSGNETVSVSVHNIASATAAIFEYYDSSYTGTTTALIQPVDVSAVRLVKMTVTVDLNENRPPGPVSMSGQVAARSLKDNY